MVGDKLRETHLRWFGHFQHKPAMVQMRRSFSMQVDGQSRKRGRPKRMWMEIIRKHLKKCSLPKDLAHERLEWGNRIHEAEPNAVGGLDGDDN